MPNTYYPWHVWFAWRPVFTKDKGWQWMTKVYRRHGFHLSPIPHGHDSWFWEYMSELSNEGANAMSENTYQALDEAHWNTLWHKHGRLKPGQTPPPYPGAQRTGKNTLFRKIKQTMTHPLNDAIEEIRSYFDEKIPGSSFEHGNKNRLSGCLISVQNTSRSEDKTPSLIYLAARCWHWLEDLGVSDPWEDMLKEYDRAKAKHGDMTLDSDKPTNEQRFFAVVEEVGEIARALTYDREHAGELISEITQLGGLALAWLAHEIRKETEK